MQLITASPATSAHSIVYPSSYNGLMIVGDCPYNEHETEPFSNSTSGTLAGLCKHGGLRIENCIQAALSTRYPDNGQFQDGDAVGCHAAATRLLELIRETQTRVVIFAGRQVLSYFKPGAACVDDERGAPFQLAPGVVGLATLHPKELYREWHMYNIIVSDFKKAAKYLANGWQPKVYDIQYQPSYSDCVHFLQMLHERKPWVAMDIETSIDSPSGTEYVTCVGFGLSASRAFVIPLQDKSNGHYFALHEEIHIWRLLALVLETGRFVGHNALHFDHWFLAYWCGILCNVVDDTMFAHWEVYTELEKSLGFCNSIYCDNPYWKDVLKLSRSGKLPRIEEFRYNGLDNCQTLEVATAVGAEFKELPPAVKNHYKFNVNLSRVFQYMSLRGCFINRPLLRSRVFELDTQAVAMEAELHALASTKLNVRSPKQMKYWLYKELRLPVKTKMVKLEDGSHEDRESADFLSLAYLAREYSDLPALMAAARLRKHQTRLSKLRKLVDETGPNGECYWNFNAVGTETGRASGYKPYNGMGVQPQNPDKRDRDLFIPGRDDGSTDQLAWLKCDLEGADAWTVAAQMLTLGDPTMFEDLKVGLKPALILALAYVFGEHYVGAERSVLVALSKEKKAYFKTAEGKKQYDTTKAVSHGTNYMMQEPTMHVTIFRKSQAELYVPINECKKLKALYMRRYPGLARLHAHIPTMLNADGYMDCPSGMRRVFFGRADNHRTRVALALLPQNNTALATNRALYNLYYRDYNRTGSGSRMFLSPINQVHDECDFVFDLQHLDRAREVFNRATDFMSNCWGVEFKIPFDANYGKHWGGADEEF